MTRLATLALLLVMSQVALFSPDYFNDNCYNHGLALHNAHANGRYWLESSATGFFFEPTAPVHPESWHRGLYIYGLSLWARWIGTGDTVMRIPHLALLLLWVVLTGLLAKRCDAGGFALGSLAGVLMLLALEDTWRVLSRAWLDDGAATVAILAAVLAFPKSMSLAGFLVGTAAFCKDFYISWILIAMGLAAFEIATAKSRARNIVQLLLGLSLALLPRVLTNLHDFGGLGSNPIRSWMNIRMFGEGSPHAFFYLTGERPFASPLAAAGGDLSVLLARWWSRPVRETVVGLVALLPVHLFCLYGLLLHAFRRSPLPGPLRGVARALALTLLFDVLFFGAGFGSGAQIRYWTVPATLELVLGMGLLAAVAREGSPPVLARPAAVALLVAALTLPGLFGLVDQLKAPEQPLLSERALHQAHQMVENGGTLALELADGDYYYSRFPQDTVLVMDMAVLIHTPHPLLERLFTDFKVRGVVSRARLAVPGLAPVARLDGHTLHERRQP